jgi:hypothetical protein
MNVLCVGQVEDDSYILSQIDAQTILPTNICMFIDREPAQGIAARRVRIAENHDILKDLVLEYKPDLVWQVEGDCELPPNTLETLLHHYNNLKDNNLGYISGVQVGRHGLYCLGAWNFKGDLTKFKSVDYKLDGLQKVDATGFYCLLSPTETWLEGICDYNGEYWGPDVNWGLSMAKNIYVDMDLHIGHKVNNGIIRPSDISTCNAEFAKTDGKWNYKQIF